MCTTRECGRGGDVHSSSLFSAHHAGVNEDGKVQERERGENDKIMVITNDNKEFVKGFMVKWQGLGHPITLIPNLLIQIIS